MQETQPIHCPYPDCLSGRIVRNGSVKGHQRYYCKRCERYFGATMDTLSYRLQTPIAEIAQALFALMQDGSIKGVARATHHTPATIRRWRKNATYQKDELIASLLAYHASLDNSPQLIAFRAFLATPYPASGKSKLSVPS